MGVCHDTVLEYVAMLMYIFLNAPFSHHPKRLLGEANSLRAG
jgi:hypothetical protein